jgi:hypothetical protein
MSQRYLAPTNLFYRQNDPWPPEFPEPNTGDVYFNTVSQTIRVFYEGTWHDASAAAAAGGGGSSAYVEKTGDTMTGNLVIDTTSYAELKLDSATSGQNAGVRLSQGGITKWLIAADDANRLVIARYDKTTGNWVETAFLIDGDTGEVRIPDKPLTSTGVATKAYVDDKMIVSTSAASGTPAAGVGTVWIQY